MQGDEHTVSGLVNLMSARVGGKALAANDEFFAPKECLVDERAPVFIPDRYTERGKWMDGWETRRKRGPGHDWCILELGMPGSIQAIDIDTQHFLGNHPPYASLEACASPTGTPDASTGWHTVLGQSPLRPGSHNVFASELTRPPEGFFTHVRLNIFPDGGVARLRVYGRVEPSERAAWAGGAELDLAALASGALAIACSDAFFSPMNNLILPSESSHMGEGWETRRRRGPGHDWVIVQAATVGCASHIVVKTTHFKGNYPDSCQLEVAYAPQASVLELINDTSLWQPLLTSYKLAADSEHLIGASELAAHAPFTHIRLSIYPDGGIARLRVFGHQTTRPR